MLEYFELCRYITTVVKERCPEVESVIIEDPGLACWYAKT